jgi:sortase A
MTVTAPRDPEVEPAQQTTGPTQQLHSVPAPRRTPRPSASRDTGLLVSSVTGMIALVCLWMAAQLLYLGGVSEARDQRLLYDRFRAELAAATAPVGPVTPVGDPVALITIPHLGVQQVVVEGTASGDLLAGPGHMRTTVLPGQVGTSVVFGRAATYGAPFARITDLQKGDEISVVMAQGQRIFLVVDVRRTGDPLPQPLAAGAARLTLVTAEGSGRFPGLAPGRAVYVDAEAAKGFVAPSGLPSALPAPEKVMAHDNGALPLLVLCLALLLALTLGMVSARQRWSAVRVWVVASAPAIALAWFTTDVVMRLLPNLM